MIGFNTGEDFEYRCPLGTGCGDDIWAGSDITEIKITRLEFGDGVRVVSACFKNDLNTDLFVEIVDQGG